MAKEKDRRVVSCKPLDRLRQGSVEVVVWPRNGRGGVPCRAYSLTKYMTNFESRTITWHSVNGLSSRDLRDLKQLVADALERELAAGGEA